MGKFDMSTPKDEVERILRQIAKKDFENTHKLGLPVIMADEVGIYYLYPDGRKEHVKLFKEDVNDTE